MQDNEVPIDNKNRISVSLEDIIRQFISRMETLAVFFITDADDDNIKVALEKPVRVTPLGRTTFLQRTS